VANTQHPSPAAHMTRPSEQTPTAEPVVNAPNLPRMEPVNEVTSVVKTTGLPLMEPGIPVGTRGQGFMAAVPERMPPAAALPGNAQLAKQTQVPGPSSGYVRLDIHVENGQLSITGLHEVAGPLAMPATVTRGYVYEVLMNDAQIALGSVPDVGVRRAFANRDVDGPEGKHRFFTDPTFDFAARIPKHQLTAETLPQMIVVLHNVQDVPDRLVASVPLTRQAGVVTSEIGRLAGIKLGVLPDTVRAQLERILSEHR